MQRGPAPRRARSGARRPDGLDEGRPLGRGRGRPPARAAAAHGADEEDPGDVRDRGGAGQRRRHGAPRPRDAARRRERGGAAPLQRGRDGGQVLAKVGTVTPHHKFKASVYVLSKEEGGRHTPFFNNYRPQFYFRTTDVTGIITLPEGTEMVMPGDNVNIDVDLIHSIALEQGTKFSIREGGRTVGAGNVTEIVE